MRDQMSAGVHHLFIIQVVQPMVAVGVGAPSGGSSIDA